MTQEEKQLVLIDLCARLPYGLHVCIKEGKVSIDVDTVLRASDINDWLTIPSCQNITFAPYLRPISSMTEEERSDMGKAIQKNYINPNGEIKSSGADNLLMCTARQAEHFIDWLNTHHFDYRGLIPMELALEAPEGMYKTE